MPSFPRQTMTTGLIILILSLLLGIQPVTTDLYLPALPTLTEYFAAPMGQAQLTLTALLLAFGTSQLVWGPLSDSYGRRPILLIGMGAYVAASVATVLASSMELLILWRTIQGAAMGAAVMSAWAIVRDLYKPAEGARVISKGLTGLGVSACLSAPLGGLITDAAGWRVALSMMPIFGAVTFLILIWRLEETLDRSHRTTLQPRRMIGIWTEILRHPTYWAFALLATFSYAGIFTFLAASSFVFIKLQGLSKTQYGLLMFSMAFFYIIGTMICRRLLPRFGVRRTVALAAGFTLTGGTLMGVLGLLGVHGVWAIMLPYYLFIVAHGVHQPCGQSGAVAPFPHAAGAASAFNGFLMTVAAFVMGSWIGRHLNTDSEASAWPLTLGLWFWSALIALTAWTLVQRHGDFHTPPQRVEGDPSA